ncbi:MAG: hypothetical protein GX638_16775 [Crenarchaeota archaeon]|nr:hypothetical protein [Thermoproteota archaeon]
MKMPNDNERNNDCQQNEDGYFAFDTRGYTPNSEGAQNNTNPPVSPSGGSGESNSK